MTEEIKPCPFCGNEPEQYRYLDCLIIKCERCRIGPRVDMSPPERAIAEWNQRVNSD